MKKGPGRSGILSRSAGSNSFVPRCPRGNRLQRAQVEARVKVVTPPIRGAGAVHPLSCLRAGWPPITSWPAALVSMALFSAVTLARRQSRAYPGASRCESVLPIHNANFLGAALLCRVPKLTGEQSAWSRAAGGETRRPNSTKMAPGRTAAPRSAGWTIFTRASTCARCGPWADLIHRVRAGAAKGSGSTGTTSSGKRRTQVFPRQNISHRHPQRGAEPDHPAGAPRSRCRV